MNTGDAVWHKGSLGLIMQYREQAHRTTALVRWTHDHSSTTFSSDGNGGTHLDELIVIDPTTGLPELERPCGFCDNRGVVENPAWTNSDPENDDLIDTLILSGTPEEIPCVECGGVGAVPTAAGMAILTVVQHSRDRII